ncbi:hypothetical protein NOVOSPHI9U_40361 [Novosphingobium sp. 9U]|nr:hypothetical protein NOVOSPHI9U_40361 [Novosphingobium sp. 9U]
MMDEQTTKQVKIFAEAGALKSALFVSALAQLRQFPWSRMLAGTITALAAAKATLPLLVR